jgi:membrane-associated protein
MTETILSVFSLYGAPALFAIVAAGQFGIPLPTSILLLTAGARTGRRRYVLLATLRLGAGRRRHRRSRGICNRTVRGGRDPRSGPPLAAFDSLTKAEALTRRWGDGSIFLSRWLFSPLGPYVNLTSGLSRHPVLRFTTADIAGEVVWIGGYLALGSLFAQSISQIADIIANAAWMIGAGPAVDAVAITGSASPPSENSWL